MPKVIFPPYNERYVRSTLNTPDTRCFLHIYGAGIVYPDSRYEFTRITDVYVFEYVVSGNGYIESEGGNALLSAGDLVITSKGKKIHYGSDKKNPYVKTWFSVTGNFIKGMFDTFMPNNKDFLVRKVNVYPLFEKMLALLEGTEADDIREMSKIIMEIILTATGKISPEHSDDISAAAHLKQYIDNFLLDNAVFKKAAEHIGIGERSAGRIFTDEYGMTPKRYITEKRLEYALELLEHSEKNVSDIAHILLYCDQSYFSTAFKKKFGLYPSEYRKAKREEHKKE